MDGKPGFMAPAIPGNHGFEPPISVLVGKGMGKTKLSTALMLFRAKGFFQDWNKFSVVRADRKIKAEPAVIRQRT